MLILGSISPSSFFSSYFLEAMLACMLLPVKIFSAWTLNFYSFPFDRTAPIRREMASWFFFSYTLRLLFSFSTSSIYLRLPSSNSRFSKEFLFLTMLPIIDYSSGRVLFLYCWWILFCLSWTTGWLYRLICTFSTWGSFKAWCCWENWLSSVFYLFVFLPFLVLAPRGGCACSSDRSKSGMAPDPTKFTLLLLLESTP